MSCIITHEGSEYAYVQSQRYWVGHKRGPKGNFVGLNCVVPTVLQCILRAMAIESGVDPALFAKPKKKSSSRKARSNNSSQKKSGPSISIF
jgi:hypothetical protein